MGDYRINFTNTDNGAFTVNVGTTNGPCFPTFDCSPPNTSSGQSTSLLLYGQGVANYGERLQENIVHLLENFAGPAYPVNPIQGQMWYAIHNYWYNSNGSWWRWTGTTWISFTPIPFSSSPPQTDGTVFTRTSPLRLYQYKTIPDTNGTVREQQLIFNVDNQTPLAPPNNGKPPLKIVKVYNGTAWTDVTDITITTVSAVQPVDPADGDLWYNTTGQVLKIFNGTAWVDTINTSDFVNNSGDTMSGVLNMNNYKITNLAAPTLSGDAVRLGYLNTQLTNLSTTYAALNGSNAFTGNINAGSHKLTNLGYPTDLTDGASRQYVDDVVASLTTTVGTGYVKLIGDIMQGSLSFASTNGTNGYRVTNLATPRAGFPYDATNKTYVDTGLTTATNALNTRIDNLQTIVNQQSDNYIQTAFFVNNTLTLGYNTGSSLTNLVIPGIASVADVNNITVDPSQIIVDQTSLWSLTGPAMQDVFNDIDYRLSTPISRRVYRVSSYNTTAVSTVNDTFTIAGDYVDTFYSGRSFYVDQGSNFTITAINTGAKKITITGNHTSIFKDNAKITISQSVNNNGHYTINGDSVLNGADTDIVVDQTLQSMVGSSDGKVHLGPYQVTSVTLNAGNTIISVDEEIPAGIVVGNDLIPCSYLCDPYYSGTYSTNVYVNGLRQVVGDFSTINVYLTSSSAIRLNTETQISAGGHLADITPGYQAITFDNRMTESTLLGLASGSPITTYTCSITVRDTTHPISINGSLVSIVATLKSEIENQTSGNATLQCKDNQLVIYDAIGTGINSTVSIVDVDLFSSITGYVGICAAVAGRSDTGSGTVMWKATINGQAVNIDQADVLTFGDLVQQINSTTTTTFTKLFPNHKLSIMSMTIGNNSFTITDGVTGACTDAQRLFFSLRNYQYMDSIIPGFIGDYKETLWYGVKVNQIELIGPPAAGDRIEILVSNLLGA